MFQNFQVSVQESGMFILTEYKSFERDFGIIKVNIHVYNNEISHHLSSQRFFFVLINLSAKMRLSKEQLNNATKCLV